MIPAEEPRWIDRLVIEAVHVDLIRTHGGLHGLRDENLLESALARPRQLMTYGKSADIASLAAAYGYGLARNHPYQDGNKRLAFVIMVVFLELNGFRFDASEADVVTMMLDVAAGDVSEDDLAEWIRGNAAS